MIFDFHSRSARAKKLLTGVGFWCFLSVVAVPLLGQGSSADQITQKLEAHLSAGETEAATEVARTLSPAESGKWLGVIAAQQLEGGTVDAAFDTADSIAGDVQRTASLQHLFAQRLGPQSVGGNSQPGGFQNPQSTQPTGTGDGNSGGVTADDFQPLIEVIQNTIATDSWQDLSDGPGTIQAYPTGVYVDAEGVLHRVKTDPRREQDPFDALSQTGLVDTSDVAKTSKLRKVSLTRLERQAQLLTAKGLPLDAAMRNLAGLTEIRYLKLFPESGDIVIAGPAGAWERDSTGRIVNVESRQPVLQLDDLIVCLRNAWSEDGKFGCQIVPRQANLAATKQFLASSKLTGKKWRDELRETLGKQDIEVFGIDGSSRAAYVLVEADYRMKRIGMGLEPSIGAVPSYLDRVKLDAHGNPPPMDVVRWWFTTSYDHVLSNESRDCFSFSGPGVKVLSETEFIDQSGKRIHTGTSAGPTKAFADDFTQHFAVLAKKYPIYQELKNIFDLAIVANLIRGQGLPGRADWNLTFFAPSGKQFVSTKGPSVLRYPLGAARVPREVDSIMNHRKIRDRQGQKTRVHTLVGVSGGVSCDAKRVASPEIRTDRDDELGQALGGDAANAAAAGWWWD